ncbi:hypothetical protein J437_LFUL012669 [Ladona fulva]|uniref:WD repeat-containing protein 36 n=1 Tax=Ladona fulva TaxID=123851 RepID=A0A8K0KHQ5_LADFU|nr:hypothetical protein J437_LFUL012669 [Ladona fulva]
MPSQKIFVKNRALGYVSNHVPLSLRYIKRWKEYLVFTCVGNAFHTYKCENLALVNVSASHPSEIEVLATDTSLVFAASGTDIYAWHRGFNRKHLYSGHSRPVKLLLPFGQHLISVDEGSNLRVWVIKTEEVYLELNFECLQFHISAILHPHSYTNKVLLGSTQGQLQLWNLHTSNLIHTFKGWGSGITVLEQSPAKDVAAIGLTSGRIILHNLLYDETVVDFRQDWGPVTAITFRTDGPPLMLSGSPEGHIAIWDLEKRRVSSQIRDAHLASISSLRCLPKEPIFISCSPDNTLKKWIFDRQDNQARLLTAKEGHAAPPTFVRFHHPRGTNVISAGADSTIRIFSTITERSNRSLGRASYNREALKKKAVTVHPLVMPPVTQFATEGARGKDWDDIVCAHAGMAVVTTWSFERTCMGSHKLLPPGVSNPKNRSVVATSLCISHCGNYTIVGYSSGQVHRFNIQSGIHRGMYGEKSAHDAAVRGLAVDNLSKITVTGGADGVIKFWHFNPLLAKAPFEELSLKEGVAYFCTHRDASLLAVIMEDFSICVIDLDTRGVVRKLEGHSNRITDATFSPDARWLITASMDCTICVWDIPSGKPVDHFRLEKACTSLALSHNGQYLATSHVDSLGIYLWCNRSLYSHISLRPISSPVSSSETIKEMPIVELPQSSVEMSLQDGEKEQLLQSDSEEEPDYISPEQIDEEMISLSSLAGSRWQNLLNIDVIRRKNKPKKPPEAPKSAPFFLPTVPSLEFKFDIKPNEKDVDKSHESGPLFSMTGFGKELLKSIESEDYFVPLNKLKALGPTSIDYEIGLLNPDGGGSDTLMLQFMKMMEFVLKSKKDFELAQAYLALFLKVNGKRIALSPSLRQHIGKLQELVNCSWEGLQEKVFFSLCAVQSLKNI